MAILKHALTRGFAGRRTAREQASLHRQYIDYSSENRVRNIIVCDRNPASIKR